jgi:hypothetical protein
MLMRLVAGPLVRMLADFSGSLRLVLAVCAALAAKTAAALLWAHAPWLLLLIALVQAAALVPTTSIADALSVTAATWTLRLMHVRCTGASNAILLVVGSGMAGISTAYERKASA